MESKYLFHQSWPDGVLTIPRIDEIISFLELHNFLSNLIFILLKLLWCILFLVWEITGLRSVETRLISSRVETGLISNLLTYLVFFFFLKNKNKKLYLAYWWHISHLGDMPVLCKEGNSSFSAELVCCYHCYLLSIYCLPTPVFLTGEFYSGSDGKESTCNMGDLGSIPGLGRSPEERSNTLQYSCLENSCGWRHLVGYSPWGRKQSDTTEWLWASLVTQSVKNLPAVQETWVQSLGWEDTLEKETANHSSILAWKMPWTEEAGGL